MVSNISLITLSSKTWIRKGLIRKGKGHVVSAKANATWARNNLNHDTVIHLSWNLYSTIFWVLRFTTLKLRESFSHSQAGMRKLTIWAEAADLSTLCQSFQRWINHCDLPLSLCIASKRYWLKNIFGVEVKAARAWCVFCPVEPAAAFINNSVGSQKHSQPDRQSGC